VSLPLQAHERGAIEFKREGEAGQNSEPKFSSPRT
jgi:hypothetical protein